jgi:hemerythrin-like domain-containing protein
MSKTIRIIQKEHRLITAVVEGIAHVGSAIGEGRLVPDFALLHAMVDYIDAFPERLHHPKEDRFLFRAIEQRTGEGAAQLAALRDEHAKSYPALERLKAALADLSRAGKAPPRASPTSRRCMRRSTGSTCARRRSS